MKKTKQLALEDGSNIAVVGGGPSGSFFSYFTLTLAERFGIDINLDIIEAKDFNCIGPLGCNHCGGIISESLIQMLSTEGIVLPPEVIRSGIETYTLHLEQGSTVIEAPGNEQRIASIFRGIGPKGCHVNGKKSFDNHLLELCKSKGANIIYDKVIEAERKENGILIKTKKQFEKEYDFVVGAIGLNQKTFELFHKLCPSFRIPKTTRTYIAEIHMEEELIQKHFGDSMHVFLLNLPNIKFGALIPKGTHVTVVLLGENVDKKVVDSFLNSEAVKKCFPEGLDLQENSKCNCYPFINVKGSRLAFSDRVVLIGDSSTSKLYKNGIGAAYLTAKAAASTAIFEGISEKHFKKYFNPTCVDLKKDNRVGRFIFAVTGIIQKTAILKKAMLRMVVLEQKKDKKFRRMSSMLWDTFTGSSSYRNIFIRFLNPKIILSLIWNTIRAIFI